MAIYNASVSESASISASRNIGGGFSTGGFSSGAYDNLGDIFRTASGDTFSSSIIVGSSVSELATGTDTLENAKFMDSSVDESVTAIDDPATTVISFVGTVDEFATGIVDDIATIATINILVSELAVGRDTINAFLNLPVSVSESAQIALTPLSPRIGFLCLVNESAQGSETVAARIVFVATAQENVIATDVLTTIASVTFNVSENVVIIDTVPTNAVYNISLSDNVLLSDLVAGRLLWEPVNTSETTDWVLVNTIN